MKTEVRPDQLVPHVYMVDMLDYLDFVTFDAGPGQAMLGEAVLRGDHRYQPPSLTVPEKLERCFELLEDGDRRLIENRKKKMDQMRKRLDRYRTSADRHVDQKGLSIG